ncbi:MAG: quinone-dependent dihydroorotate dehydrogenase [Deltaproteobacteria bacterium]|nr:quinone-dependent dihydroorotate dehydrogenase [Deltaproteobacteria bacterium]
MKLTLNNLYRQLRPFLFAGDAEKVHERMLSSVEFISKIPGFLPLLRKVFFEENPLLHTQLFDNVIDNPIGLAAGFDKDGRIHPALFALGFGFVEIGTVTPHPQKGNPRPRLFRLPEDQAVINRMGFNNQGAWKMAERLVAKTLKIKSADADLFEVSGDYPANISSGMLGINIGKNKDTTLENATDDYVSALSTLHPFADYFTLNISSPNTKDLRNMQEKEALRILLDSVCARRDELDRNHSRNTPLLVKLAPDLDEDALKNSVRVMQEFSIQGVIATNTTVARPVLKSKYRTETGGLSGKPLQKRSTEMIRTLFAELGTDIPIIGVGGIFNGADAYEKIKAGAAAVQIYTALIYEGPGLVRKVKAELADLLERDGYKSVSEAVGADH